jgi:hypothetical protein
LPVAALVDVVVTWVIGVVDTGLVAVVVVVVVVDIMVCVVVGDEVDVPQDAKTMDATNRQISVNQTTPFFI